MAKFKGFFGDGRKSNEFSFFGSSVARTICPGTSSSGPIIFALVAFVDLTTRVQEPDVEDQPEDDHKGDNGDDYDDDLGDAEVVDRRAP